MSPNEWLATHRSNHRRTRALGCVRLKSQDLSDQWDPNLQTLVNHFLFVLCKIKAQIALFECTHDHEPETFRLFKAA